MKPTNIIMVKLTAFFLLVVIVLVSCSDESSSVIETEVVVDSGVEGTSPDLENEATPDLESEATLEDEVQTHPEVEIVKSVYLIGPNLLEEDIFITDAIVRARFVSVETGYRVRPKRTKIKLEPGDPIYYVPAMIYEFEVLEYLKGAGPSVVTMVDTPIYEETEFFETKEEALNRANEMLTGRYVGFDHRDAILFLDSSEPRLNLSIMRPSQDPSVSGKSNSLEYYGSVHTSWFTPFTEDIAKGQSADTQAFNVHGHEEFRGASSNGRLFVTDPNGPRGASGAATSEGEMTVSELKWWISEVQKLESRAAEDQAFMDCLFSSWFEIRRRNIVEDGHAPTEVREQILSGQGKGSVIFSGEAFGASAAEAPTHRLTGRSAHLFEAQHIDHDGDRRTGYESRTVITRPLPAGVYEVGWGIEQPEFGLCGFPEDEVLEQWTITAVTTPDVVHEAFFDPGATAYGEVGFDYEEMGSIEPGSLDLPRGGGKSGIDRIVWYEDSVEVEFEPHVDMSDYEMDIIELDATTSLTLSFGSALVRGERVRGEGDSRSYVWEHCEQPWHAGDQLMIRIREAGATGAEGPGVRPKACGESGTSGSDGPSGSSSDPTAPKIVDAEEEGKSVELIWAAPEADIGTIVGYRIYRAGSEDAELGVVVDDTGSTSTSYIDETLDYGTTYRFAVRAVLTNGKVSGLSETITITTNDFAE